MMPVFTGRVPIFSMTVTTEDSYFVVDGVWNRTRKKRPSLEAGAGFGRLSPLVTTFAACNAYVRATNEPVLTVIVVETPTPAPVFAATPTR